MENKYDIMLLTHRTHLSATESVMYTEWKIQKV